MNWEAIEPWMTTVHVLGVLGFVLAHGVSAFVMIRLYGKRHDPDPVKIRELLELSSGSFGLLYLSLAVLVVAGTISGIIGGDFTDGTLWLWLSIAILVAIFFVMWGTAHNPYARLREAVGAQTLADKRARREARGPGSREEIVAALASPLPMVAATAGIVGLAAITVLMVVHPI